MRVNRLLPLVIVLIVLVVAVVFLKRRPAPIQLSEEVGFERLVPDSLKVDAVKGVDLYQGEKADQAVQLRRHDADWVATSYHDAPAKPDKIKQLLDQVSQLAGELRSQQADLLKDFRLEDKQALHLLLYTTDMNKPAVHLLAAQGKGQEGFVRVADDPKVYHVNLNLYSEAGLYGEEVEKGPEAKPWLDLQLQDIPRDQIAAVGLDTPLRRFELVKEEPEAPKDKAGAEAKAATESKPAAEPKWVLVEPKVDEPLKQGVVDGLVSTLATLRGDDVVALDKVAEYGLDNADYQAHLTVQEKDKEPHQVTVRVGREVPKEEGKRYVRVGQEGPVYILPSWSFEQMFPTLGTLVTLDVLSVQPDQVESLTWQQDGNTWAVERRAGDAKPTTGDKAPETAAPKPADTWHRVQGDGATVDAAAVESVLNTTQNLTANDWFSEPPETTALDDPALSLSLKLKDGTTHRVRFGKAHGEDEDRYAGLDDGTGVFIIAKATYTSLTESLDKLRPETTSAAPSAVSPATSSVTQPVETPATGSTDTSPQVPAVSPPAGPAPTSAESAKP